MLFFSENLLNSCCIIHRRHVVNNTQNCVYLCLHKTVFYKSLYDCAMLCTLTVYSSGIERYCSLDWLLTGSYTLLVWRVVTGEGRDWVWY